GDEITDRRLREAFFNHDKTVGLADRRDDRVEIERTDRTKVDDFSIDTHSRKLCLSLDCVGHADAERDNRDVLTGLVDTRLADRQDEIIHLRHFKALAVENLVLKEDDRVRIANRSLQEALCVGSRVRHDDLETWNVTVPG